MVWLNSERVRAYSWMLVAGYLAAIAGLHWMARDMAAAGQVPMGLDFDAFHGASLLLGDGDAARLWDRDALLAAQHRSIALSSGGAADPAMIARQGLKPWHYPPHFLFLVAPLAAVPWAAAYLGWSAATAIPYLAAARRILAGPLAIPLALAFPASAVTVMMGQNGFLTAGLMGWGLALLPGRPALAGVFVGLLTVKPQFGLLLPVALIAGGHWRTIAAATATTLAAVVASAAVFGTAAWAAFLTGFGASGEALAGGVTPYTLMPSVYAALRLAGIGPGTALAVQAAVGLGCAAVVAALWRRNDVPHGLKAAGLILATLLANPFEYHYDLPVLFLALAWLGRDIAADGWRRSEMALFALAALLPLTLALPAKMVGLQPGPLVVAGLLACLIARARHRRRGGRWSGAGRAPR